MLSPEHPLCLSGRCASERQTCSRPPALAQAEMLYYEFCLLSRFTLSGNGGFVLRTRSYLRMLREIRKLLTGISRRPSMLVIPFFAFRSAPLV